MLLYRGFNNNYPNMGVRPEQKGIWMTDDYEYAEVYANMFVHGSVVEADVDITKSKFLDEETGESIFGEDFNELGCGETDIDGYICDEIIKMGYDGIEMEQKGSKIYLIVNRNILKNIKIIKEFENDPDNDEFMESLINNILKNAGVKQLNESIVFNDEVYNDFEEKYDQLTVILNPSIDWLRNKLNKPDAWGFRFLHNVEKNKLYVWDTHQSWMHQQVFDIVNMDWSKPGMNVVGIFEPEGVAIWEELADDGKRESSIALAKKLDGKLFDELYPNGYKIYTCS